MTLQMTQLIKEFYGTFSIRTTQIEYRAIAWACICKMIWEPSRFLITLMSLTAPICTAHEPSWKIINVEAPYSTAMEFSEIKNNHLTIRTIAPSTNTSNRGQYGCQCSGQLPVLHSVCF